MIPYGRQDITQSDVDAVIEVLRSDFLTQGPAIGRFEKAVADRVGVPHAIAMNSATSALHVACLALGLGPGDWLWTVPNTFVASANCALYCGAGVDFVDIDPRTWNMSVDALEARLVAAEKAGRLPKIVVPVHFGGQPTDQQRIHALGQRYGFAIIEDASHAIGAARDGEPVGSCRWSDITVFSFHPVKIVTSAEGGMALTRDAGLARRMARLRTHGITRAADEFRTPAPADWYYEQQSLGFNYRMTDVHAALGASQLARLDQYIERRNALAARYDDALAPLDLQRPFVEPGNISAWHLYVVHVAEKAGRRNRDELFKALRARGIGVNVHYAAVHLQPYYRDLGFEPGSMPHAETHGRTALTLPLYPTLTDAQQDSVVQALTEEY
jgi:UDP-4-amino-4,6-dideoxy-N-acetyl-beta-L-altrosamine transaminase